MIPLGFAGQEFRVVGGRALYWPARHALLVADLHLEKASWFAERGQMLPPHDSHETLSRIAAIITQTAAQHVWCLGDNFHDDDGPHRMSPPARTLLSALCDIASWHWIIGNHDSQLPSGIGGEVLAEAELDGVILRHEADPDDPRPEISGHFHPKYRARGARGGVTRACFVGHKTKLIMPSFGSLTGGLFADHPVIAAAMSSPASALIPTRNKLLRFEL